MKNSNIIYSLNIEDIQTVANKEIGRNLSQEEVEHIKPYIQEKIKWYDVIADTINENIANV